MSKIITIVGNEVVVTSTNGVETQVQKIQLKNNYYTQLKGTNVSILNNEHHVVYVIPAADFSPASTASQIQALLTGIINADTEAVVSSATWGFDTASILFYVKQMSDGSLEYESPIGTPATPTGDVKSQNTAYWLSNFFIIETTANGSIGGDLLEFEIQNITGTTGLANGVNLAGNKSISGRSYHVTSTDKFFYCPSISYDAGGVTTFLITYLTA